VSKQYGLTLNKHKTKVMIIDRRNHTNTKEIAGFEVIQNFSYLGSIISNNRSCESEIRRARRVDLAWQEAL